MKPAASRPHIPDYGISVSRRGLLGWSHAVDRLGNATDYWITTAGPGGQPHAVPVQGVWVEDALFFGGGPAVRWARNLAVNPQVTVVIGDGAEALMLVGSVERTGDSRDRLAGVATKDYGRKLQFGRPPPFWVLHGHG